MPDKVLFTSAPVTWEIVTRIAKVHGLTLTVMARHDAVIEWTIETMITLADLCNFTNDLGSAGVQATASMQTG